jgi:hypoxanthine phosphoribosyltransferase
MSIEVAVSVAGIVVGIPSLIGAALNLFQQPLSLRRMLQLIKKLGPQISEFNPDVVIGVSDGIVPAAVIAANFGISRCEFLSMPVARGQHNERVLSASIDIFSNLRGKKVLVVDHHLYSGFNLLSAVTQIKRMKPRSVRTLVLHCHIQENTQIIPDIIGSRLRGKIRPVPWSITDYHRDKYSS